MRPYPRITSGARVALVAPAGPLKIPADVDRALANVQLLGWEAVLGEHVRERDAYFAGSDAARLEDFNRALRDQSVDAIWCLRGGYGAMRLLEGLDYDGLRRSPKTLIGYSDITALHCAFARTVGLSSIHGPTARTTLTATTERSLRAASSRGDNPLGDASQAVTLVGGRARGRLAGGNLAMLCALHATRFQPDYSGAILVLEDVNEAPYRIERMLLQLRLSGALAQCAGIAFGSFTNTGDTADSSLGGDRSVDEVIREAAELVGVPSICGIPMGHIKDQWSIPLGCEAELDADTRTLVVNFS